MEQVLFNQSRIPPRMTFLKPLSAAIAIGTGGPFGAEGPIIATGGALGSLVGQLLRITADERKTLLAAGRGRGHGGDLRQPGGGRAARDRAAALRVPPALADPRGARRDHGDRRARLSRAAPRRCSRCRPLAPPAARRSRPTSCSARAGPRGGGRDPRGLRDRGGVRAAAAPLDVVARDRRGRGGRGRLLRAAHAGRRLQQHRRHRSGGPPGARRARVASLCKFVSWSIALGSGTSGGTLAPLFTIGGGLGALLGLAAAALLPGLGVDPRVAALVGMAAMFAGASRALLASVVFAFETTRQPWGCCRCSAAAARPSSSRAC